MQLDHAPVRDQTRNAVILFTLSPAKQGLCNEHGQQPLHVVACCGKSIQNGTELGLWLQPAASTPSESACTSTSSSTLSTLCWSTPSQRFPLQWVSHFSAYSTQTSRAPVAATLQCNGSMHQQQTVQTVRSATQHGYVQSC